MPEHHPPFDGVTYDPELDGARLATLLNRVSALMGDGQWRTLAEIVAQVGGTEPSVSARLRDLRKPKFGGYTVDRRRRGAAERGIHEYRLGRAEPDVATPDLIDEL